MIEQVFTKKQTHLTAKALWNGGQLQAHKEEIIYLTQKREEETSFLFLQRASKVTKKSGPKGPRNVVGRGVRKSIRRKRPTFGTEALVQCRNWWTSPKSIGEAAGGLLGRRPWSLEIVSCSRATPDLHRCNLEGCSRARDIFETPGPSPQKTTGSFSYQFRGSSGISALYQGLRVPNLFS